MSYLDKYRVRDSMYGSSLRDERIKTAQLILSEYFKDNPSYQEVYINDSVDPVGVWIVDNSETKDTQKIISLVQNPINAGDLVLWNNLLWMVTVKDDFTDIYNKGIISKCISELKWLDDKGVIRNAFFTYRNEDLTNFGTDDGKIISLGNERRHIYVQSNEHTKKIKKYQRFIIDSRAWKVISIDRLKQGLIYLVLQEDEIDNAKDNLELGIADYIQYHFTLHIVGGNAISIEVGQSQTLHVEVMRNGEIVEGYEVAWESSDPDIVEVNANGEITAISVGSASITARMKDHPDIHDKLSVTVAELSSEQITVTINGLDSLIVGDEASYKAIVFNNGAEDNSKEVEWKLTDADGVSPTNKAKILNIQGKECVLEAKSVGTVKLQCVVIGYPTSTYDKEIKIKYLF